MELADLEVGDHVAYRMDAMRNEDGEIVPMPGRPVGTVIEIQQAGPLIRWPDGNESVNAADCLEKEE